MADPIKKEFSAERGPAQIVMAVTSRCNLRCVVCEHSMMKVEKKDFDLNLVDRMGIFFPPPRWSTLPASVNRY